MADSLHAVSPRHLLPLALAAWVGAVALAGEPFESVLKLRSVEVRRCVPVTAANVAEVSDFVRAPGRGERSRGDPESIARSVPGFLIEGVVLARRDIRFPIGSPDDTRPTDDTGWSTTDTGVTRFFFAGADANACSEFRVGASVDVIESDSADCDTYPPEGICAFDHPVWLADPETWGRYGALSSVPLLTRLELTVRVDYETERIDGTATLTVRNGSTAPIARVPLLLNRLMRVEAVRGDGGRSLVHRQQVRTFVDVPKYQVDAVEVDLPEPLPPNGSVRLAVDYGGYLVGYSEVGMLYIRDRVDRAFTILREDALAFPVLGVPSLEVDRAAARGAFDFEVAATVPRDLVVVTGGEQTAREVHDGLATFRFRSRGPAPYLVVAVAPFRIAERDELRVFHFADDAAGAEVVLRAAERSAARLQEIFGPLDRPLALNVIEIPDGWGSQASLTGGIIQEASTFRDAGQLYELYHEMSHLWNAEDLDTPSPRWNEGLATFLQGRLSRELDGWDGEAAALGRIRTELLARCVADAPCARVPLRRYGSERMTDLSYRVGRLMFAELYAALGQEKFDRALRRHFQAYRVSGTRTDDLVRSFVDVGGEPAQRVFERWLDSTAWLAELGGER